MNLRDARRNIEARLRRRKKPAPGSLAAKINHPGSGAGRPRNFVTGWRE